MSLTATASTRRIRSRWLVLLAVLAALVLSVTVNQLAFGDTPRQAERSRLAGTVITNQPMSLAPQLSQVGTGSRISYLTTDSRGQQIPATGTVLRPKNNSGAGRHKIIAWAHGTAGSADRCAPSRFANLYPSANYPNYADTVAGFLREGYTVVAADYPGLGDPTRPHPYLVGDSEARSVIDSVRAARGMYPSLTRDYVVAGHSQGGQAALFAGEIADTYGDGLNLKGVVAIAPASGLDALATQIAGTPGQGYLVLGIYGLAAVDPSVRPERILARPAITKANVIQNGCFDDILPAFADFTPEQLLVNGELAPELVEKFAAQNPGQQASTVPVMLVQGTIDDTVPLEFTQGLLLQECANGVATQLTTYEGKGHDDVLPASAVDIKRDIADRFAGQTAPTNCA